jgi:hypothetical protein
VSERSARQERPGGERRPVAVGAPAAVLGGELWGCESRLRLERAMRVSWSSEQPSAQQLRVSWAGSRCDVLSQRFGGRQAVRCLAAARLRRGWLDVRRVFSVHPRPCASSTRLKKRHRRFHSYPPCCRRPRIPRHQFLTLLQAHLQPSTRYRYVSPAGRTTVEPGFPSPNIPAPLSAGLLIRTPLRYADAVGLVICRP